MHYDIRDRSEIVCVKKGLRRTSTLRGDTEFASFFVVDEPCVVVRVEIGQRALGRSAARIRGRGRRAAAGDATLRGGGLVREMTAGGQFSRHFSAEDFHDERKGASRTRLLKHRYYLFVPDHELVVVENLEVRVEDRTSGDGLPDGIREAHADEVDGRK